MGALHFGKAWHVEAEKIVAGRDGHPCRIFTVRYAGRLAAERPICPDPDCTAPSMTIHDSRDFTIVDAPAFGHHVRWEFKRRRYRCGCGRTAHEPLPRYIDDENGVTARCNVLVRHQAARQPFLQVGNMVGLSESVVRRIVKAAWERQTPANHTLSTPRYLGVDEIFLSDPKDKANPHRVKRAVLVDLETSNVLDILDGVSRDSLVARLRAFDRPNRIRAVAVDLSGAFRNAVRMALPNAVIIADRFHVEKDIQKAFDTVRVAEMKKRRADGSKQTPFARPEYRTITRDLRARTLPRGADRQERLAEFLAFFPDIRAAHEARQAFKAIWESGMSQAEAVEAFTAWDTALPEGIRPAFASAIGTIWDNKEVVFSYFGFRITNAATESTNATIRRVSRVAPSLHLDTLRKKMLARGRFRPKTHYLCDGCGSREPIRGEPTMKEPEGELLTRMHPFTIRAGDLIRYPDESCLCDGCHVVAASVDPATWPKDRIFDLRRANVRRRPTGLAAPLRDGAQSALPL